MEIKNLKKAADLIKKNVKEKTPIVLFGDADLDGATALLVLEEAVRALGGNIVNVYFPDRNVEGYGLSNEALGFLKQFAPGLLITLDCGIGNFRELKTAESFGFTTIIIDHHEVLGRLPENSLVVDPKQKEEEYPFKQLATAGLAYYLACELSGGNLSEKTNQSWLEIVALATLADLMIEESDNKYLIEKGFSTIKTSFRPGLRAITGLLDKPEYSLRQLAQKIVSALNISEIENHLTKCYLLLSCRAQAQAESIARDIVSQSQKRQQLIFDMTASAEAKINARENFIFLGESHWEQVLTGAVASRICAKHKKPVFIFRIGSGKSRGSARTPKQIDSVKALSACGHLLEVYGGHANASGFTVSNENIDKFRQCLGEYFKQNY